MAIETYFEDIADAIRERGGTSAVLTPADMPQAILDIPGGGGEKLLADWDFTESLIDSISGLSCSLGSATTQDSTGVHFGNRYSYIYLPRLIQGNARKYSLELGSTTLTGNMVNRLFTLGNYGFMYMGNNVWGFTGSNSRATDSNITNVNYFTGSTIDFEIDMVGNWKIYKDGVLVYTPDQDLSMVRTDSFYIGSANNSCYGATIKSFKVYS